MKTFQHLRPAWGWKADFILRLEVAYSDATVAEQVWTRQLSSRIYELCCIPFVAYDLALGDELLVDEELRFTGHASPGGRQTVRLYSPQTLADLPGFVGELEAHGLLFESYSARLYAIDFPSIKELELFQPRLEHWRSISGMDFEHSNAVHP